MTLDQYLSIDGHTVASLAKAAKTTEASIHRLLYGNQQPSAQMIRALVKATKGAVSADDLIFGKPRKKKARAA